MTGLIAWIAALAALVVVPAGAQARTVALLVGVSDYEEASGLTDLRGPPNDVALLRETLEAQGVDDVRLLADGIAGAARPTRAVILDALAAIAGEVGPGDLVYLHVSSHGTRQPDADDDEPDGLDEVILPADAGPGGPDAIANALTDDDLGRAVLAIRETGADVWVVIDACHSGSGLRAGSEVAARFVDPAALGLDLSRVAARGLPEPMLDPEAAAPGRLLAFYAAQADEVAVEVDMDGEGGFYGLLSARLAARLAAGGGLSYRQLFQGVLADMNTMATPGGARLQTPSWEGDLIDAPVLGTGGRPAPLQFAVEGGAVLAGRIQGVSDGTVLALVADAADSAQAALGFAQAFDAGATRATLRAVGPDCEPGAAPCAEVGPLPEARFARVVARPLDVAVRLAAPRDLATGEPLPTGHPTRALLAAAAEKAGAAVVLDDPDWTVEVLSEADRLWFGPRAARDGRPSGLSWSPADGLPLAATLSRIARAEELATILSEIAATASPVSPSPVAVTASLAASASTDLDPTDDPLTECRRAATAALGRGTAPLPDGATLKQCDLVAFEARGTAPGARDVNRIHVDARFCVTAEHLRLDDGVAAAPLGEPMVMCSDCPDGPAAGEERLFVLVTEARDNAEPLNLEGLVETCGGGSSRGVGALARLESLAGAGPVRGAFGGFGLAEAWVEARRWTVIPREAIPTAAP